MRWLLPLLTACTGTPSAPPAPEAAPGWGAVLHVDGTAWLVGGGDTVVGPKATGPATRTEGPPGRCGGQALTNPPPNAVLSPPTGSTVTAPVKPPAVPAPVVEAAVWRLDELLPAPDAYTPMDPTAEPARQRGVDMGSLVKTRRHAAPPILLAAGTRSCGGALAVLDAKATKVHDSIAVPELCGTARVLPPADLDGDGNMETALFTDERVVAARIHSTGSTVRLEKLGEWGCPATE